MNTILLHCLRIALCCSPFARAADDTLAALVRKLDVIRLPGSSFIVEVNANEKRTGEAVRDLYFHLYAKTAASTSASAFVTLIAIHKPAEDQNKLLLTKDSKVWFYDPRSNHATVLSTRQLWQHTFAADTLTGRMADQYNAKVAGTEAIETLDAGRKGCTVIDFTPKDGIKLAAETLRYWLTEDGRPYQMAFFAASSKLLRKCRLGGYSDVLGIMRPTRYEVDDTKGACSFQFSKFQATDLPESIFDSDNLPRLRLTGEAKQ